ncbi:hypothetical protein AB0L12_10935 [Streptomyces cellulosae]
MNTAQWALLVSCLAALFTGLNMLASWMTFRRAKPRVQAGFSVFVSDETDLALLIDLRNKGQYPITVTDHAKVWVTPLKERPQTTILGKILGTVYRSEMDVMLDGRPGYPITLDIPVDEPREIPAFGGISLQCQLDTQRYADQFPDNVPLYARVDVTLSNGTQSRTTWVRIWDPKSTAANGYLPRKG